MCHNSLQFNGGFAHHAWTARVNLFLRNPDDVSRLVETVTNYLKFFERGEGQNITIGVRLHWTRNINRMIVRAIAFGTITARYDLRIDPLYLLYNMRPQPVATHFVCGLDADFSAEGWV